MTTTKNNSKKRIIYSDGFDMADGVQPSSNQDVQELNNLGNIKSITDNNNDDSGDGGTTQSKGMDAQPPTPQQRSVADQKTATQKPLANAVATKPVTPTTKPAKKNRMWLFVAGGVILLGAIGYFVIRKFRK